MGTTVSFLELRDLIDPRNECIIEALVEDFYNQADKHNESHLTLGRTGVWIRDVWNAWRRNEDFCSP